MSEKHENGKERIRGLFQGQAKPKPDSIPPKLNQDTKIQGQPKERPPKKP